MSCCCLLYCPFQAFFSKGNIDHTDTVRRRPGKENDHNSEQEPDTQDAVRQSEFVTPKEPKVATPKEPAVATLKELAVATPEEPAVATLKEPAVAAPKQPAVVTPKEPEVAIATPKRPAVALLSEAVRQELGEENNHSTEQDPDTQDANMKDAPSCEKCGKIFPWNQPHLKWKHMQECTGPAESGESVPKATPSVARSQTLPQSSQSRYTGLSTTSGSSKSHSQQAATNEHTGGGTFQELQLRWKHKCEPTEVARAPDPPRQWIQSSASNLGSPVSVANVEDLFTSSTVELGVGSETDDATLTCRCGKIFTENQRREYVIHKLQCREGTPPAPPSAGRHYQATLPRQ